MKASSVAFVAIGVGRALRTARGVAASAGASAAGLTRSRVAAASVSAAPAAARGPTRSLFIQVEQTPNPDSIKFKPEGKVVLPEHLGNGMHFSDLGQAKGSKLVRRLLKLEQVTGVFLGRDFLSVNKKEDVGWMALKPVVLDAIMDAYAEMEASGAPIIADVPPAEDTRITDADDEVTAMIKELLETRIRPAVQEDGGDIFFAGFNHATGVVRLQMAGSCVGCPSSTATLRNGVENMLMHYIPEVKGIEQVMGELEVSAEREVRSLEDKLAAAGVPAP